MTAKTLKKLAPWRSNHKTVKTMSMRLRQLIVMGVLTVEEFEEMPYAAIQFSLFPLGNVNHYGAVSRNVKATHPDK